MKERLARAEQGRVALQAQRNDRWYPIFHIAAPAGWINDPNGLCYFRGRHQVYFQHHPFGTDHGPMHWGHVSSPDLVTWRHEPIALAPSLEADAGGVFSGSAVVTEAGELAVYYTGNRWITGSDGERGNIQAQCMAISTDGTHFEKRGVVIEPPAGVADSRDPKVWQVDGTWYMVYGVRSVEGRGQVWLYTSADMVTWEFQQVLFEDPDPGVYMLECPDFFPLDGKWVLIYCPMGVSARGDASRNTHNAGYVVGDWAPGTDFSAVGPYQPMDWGHHFYAPQTYLAPDGRRIAYGWMGSFTTTTPPQDHDGWAGQLTVARQLSLDADHRLRNQPLDELAELRRESVNFGTVELTADQDMVLAQNADALEIELELDLSASTARRCLLRLHHTGAEDGGGAGVRGGGWAEEASQDCGGAGGCGDAAAGGGDWSGDAGPSGEGAECGTTVYYHAASHRVVLDRGPTGQGERDYRAAPVSSVGRLSLRVLVDRGSVEVFLNHHEASISSFSFPGTGDRAVVLSAEAGTVQVEDLTVHRLSSIWK